MFISFFKYLRTFVCLLQCLIVFLAAIASLRSVEGFHSYLHEKQLYLHRNYRIQTPQTISTASYIDRSPSIVRIVSFMALHMKTPNMRSKTSDSNSPKDVSKDSDKTGKGAININGKSPTSPSALPIDIPKPLQNIVDINIQRNCIVYEVELSKQNLAVTNDLDIVMDQGRPTIGQVIVGRLRCTPIFCDINRWMSLWID